MIGQISRSLGVTSLPEYEVSVSFPCQLPTWKHPSPKDKFSHPPCPFYFGCRRILNVSNNQNFVFQQVLGYCTMQIFVNTLFRRGGNCQGDNRPVRPIYGKESGLGISSVPTSETANGVVGLDLDYIFTKSDLF